MVLIEIDSNAILVEAMKNRTAGEMIRAYLVLVTRLSNVGVKPKMHIRDNECSEEFKAQIRKNNMTFQLVPPHDHRRNIAEKATPYQSVCSQIVLLTSATISCKTPYNYHPIPSTLPFKDAQTNSSPTYLPHNNTYSMYLHVPSMVL